LIVYFAGGILGNILYILLREPLSVAVGASGSVFALGGALTMMRPKLSVLVFPIPVPLPLWVAVIGGFLILSFLPFVAWGCVQILGEREIRLVNGAPVLGVR